MDQTIADFYFKDYFMGFKNDRMTELD